MLRSIGSRALALAAVAGTAYLALAVARMRAFARRAATAGDGPSITVIKPLHGDAPYLEANLASFCEQDKPGYQVVFCAVDAADPAVVTARRLVERFPSVDAEVVVRPPARIANPKMANAQNALERAKHEIVAIVDADMRVDSGYARAVAHAFTNGAGAATCLYAGVAAGGTAATLAAMFVNDHFAPSVLVADAFEPLEYCFGSTMAVRREVLAEIGGLGALGETVADDHALGARVAASGRSVVLADYVVENVFGETSLGAVLRRELRWARTIRSVRPIGSTLAVVTYGLPLALLAWFVRPRSPRRALLFVAAALLRLQLHLAARSALSPRAPFAPHLVLIRDLLTLGVWAASRSGSTVRWHGREIGLR